MGIRNVRNFWLDAEIDGHLNHLSGGPREKTGGLAVELCVRHNGEPVPAATVTCFHRDGRNHVAVAIYRPDGTHESHVQVFDR